MNSNLDGIHNFFRLFDMEVIDALQIINQSESGISIALILCLTLFTILFKLFELRSKIKNPFQK